jgi:hypothetical protein
MLIFFKKIYDFIDILEVQIHFLEFKRKQRKMEKLDLGHGLNPACKPWVVQPA